MQKVSVKAAPSGQTPGDESAPRSKVKVGSSWVQLSDVSIGTLFTILHISDLHRTPGENLSNAELISALVGDRNRYTREDPAIAPPEAIVVSGDIIQGVPLGTDEPAAALAAQYRVAYDFLVELADRFVDGDRSRVVIVPGNHDIDWAAARAAMEPVAEDAKVDLPKVLLEEDSLYRWDWRGRALYTISNPELYERRLDAFWTFFEEFYEGVPGLLQVGRDRAVNLFSLAGGRIGVAAFNSCYGNDCFSFQGQIRRESVAQAHLELSDPKHGFELLMAVWHHNVEGPPQRSDYMDIDIVRGMIGRGFRLGLFGHQHRPEAVPYQIHLAELETMAVTAAGSLCAGAKELPPGSHRGYNVIELADDLLSARVHVRQMDTVSNLFTRSRRQAFGGQSWMDIQWLPPADLLGRPVNARRASVDAAIEAADRVRRDDASAAIAILQPHRAELPDFGRRMLIEAALSAQALPLARELLTPPRSLAELIDLTDLLIRMGDVASAERALDQHASTLGLAPNHTQELRLRITARRTTSR